MGTMGLIINLTFKTLSIMENLKELEVSEMVQISGGVNLAYEIGYAVGSLVKKLTLLKFISEIL
jgi:hypothetical protein